MWQSMSAERGDIEARRTGCLFSQNIPSRPYSGMQELAQAYGKQQVSGAKVAAVVSLLPTQDVGSMFSLSWGGCPQPSLVISASRETNAAPGCRQQRALCSWPTAHTLQAGFLSRTCLGNWKLARFSCSHPAGCGYLRRH